MCEREEVFRKIQKKTNDGPGSGNGQVGNNQKGVHPCAVGFHLVVSEFLRENFRQFLVPFNCAKQHVQCDKHEKQQRIENVQIVQKKQGRFQNRVDAQNRQSRMQHNHQRNDPGQHSEQEEKEILQRVFL